MTGNEPAELPDTHLVEMATRDPAAFVHLYDRYVQPIYSYCAQRLPRAAAEDATSVTFLNALKAIDTFDHGRSGFRAWLFTIAHNAVYDQLRVRNHASIDDFAFVDSDAAVVDHVIALDERQRLWRAVAKLPVDQQQAIHLRLASLTGVEIAQVMGRSHVAVRALQHRALKRLRILLHPSAREDESHDQR